ncbi:hypothetical protein BCM26_05815 [Bacillus subtilis]|nr:hypothetical protein BCM26_05815 [Bacillus subtilis]OJH63521.1 hypothetical protein BOH71_09760 [Bacillus subtilis]
MRKMMHNISDNTLKYWVYIIVISMFISLIGAFLKSSEIVQIGVFLPAYSFLLMGAVHIYLCIEAVMLYFRKIFKLII